MIIRAFGDRGLPPAPSPRTRARQEQSAGIETGLLAAEDGSIERLRTARAQTVWAAKPNRKGNHQAGRGFWQRSRYGSLSARAALLLPLPPVPPADPSPCSDMPQFHFYCRNASPSEGLDLEKCSWRARACLFAETGPSTVALAPRRLVPPRRPGQGSAWPCAPAKGKGSPGGSGSAGGKRRPGHIKGPARGWSFRPTHPGWP